MNETGHEKPYTLPSSSRSLYLILASLAYAVAMLTVAVSTVQVLLANYLGATYFYESGTHPHLNDFVPYYAAASLGRHCLISHECIYSPALQAHFADLALAPQSLTHQFTLQYPV
ncbi:MAG TPA: hypothetical protein V6C97_36085 [Oculatellaceae cyanobacterium]